MKLSKKIRAVAADKYFAGGLVILFAALIFYFSSLPHPIPEILEGSLLDRLLNYSIQIGLAHAVEYAILSLLLFRALYTTKVKNAAVYAAIIAILYGVSDEIHQYFVPGRVCDLIDVLFNSIGAVAVQFVGKIRLLFLK